MDEHLTAAQLKINGLEKEALPPVKIIVSSEQLDILQMMTEQNELLSRHPIQLIISPY